MTAHETSSEAAQVRQPITDEMLRAWGVAEKDFADAREMVEADLDALEVRGPLHFDFGPDKLGEFEALDMQTAEGRVVEAQGTLDVPTFTRLFGWDLHHPSVDLIRRNPWRGFDSLRVIGASDEILAALAEDEKATQIWIHGHVSADDVKRAEEEVAEETEWLQGEIAKLLESGEITQDDADQQTWPECQHREGGSTLTDDGLRSLTGHPHLKELSLRGADITDAALAEVLSTLPQLTQFDIVCDTVTGDFLQHIAAGEMTVLGIVSSALRGDAIALPPMPQAVAVDLVGPGVLDGLDSAALARALPALESLRIGDYGRESGLDDDRMLDVFAHFPGVEVNGLTMSRKAVEKVARKRGLTLNLSDTSEAAPTA